MYILVADKTQESIRLRKQKAEPISLPSNKKERILVVDDDPDILEALQLMLEFNDYEVITDTGNSIDKKIAEGQPALIILDILLNGIDGRDICRKLKRKKQTRDIPVLLISAHVDIRSTDDICGEDFLAKPFNIEALYEKVEKYIHKKTIS